MEQELEKKLEQAIWVAHSLFDRNKTNGSSANLSFIHNDKIYISGSGTCFGTLKKTEFSIVDFSGKRYNEVKPSKELQLHKIFYEKNHKVRAIVHIHSFYSVIFSCLDGENTIPKYTPYLEMKLGKIGVIPYAPPGTEELFALFAERADEKRGYLLKNHGQLVGGGDIIEAFYGAEELEESAKVAWYLREKNVSLLP